ncbi:M48 family metallopeptidase [Pasteurella multocida]
MVDRYFLYQDAKEIKEIITYLDFLFRYNKYKPRLIEKKCNDYMRNITITFSTILLVIYFFVLLDNFENEYVKIVFFSITLSFAFVFTIFLFSNVGISIFYMIKDRALKNNEVRSVLYDVIALDKLMGFDEVLLKLTKADFTYQMERHMFLSKIFFSILSIFAVNQVFGISISYKELLKNMSINILNPDFWILNMAIILATISILGVVSLRKIYKYKFYIHIIEVALFKKIMFISKQLVFVYGKQIINFTYQYSKNAKRLRIYVYPDYRIRLIVPEHRAESDILAAVQKRRRWIVKQLAYFREQQKDISPRQYVSGESHYYLGRQYVLKVIETSQSVQAVKFFRGKLEVNVVEKNAENVKKWLEKWYRAKAKVIFQQRLTTLLDQALWMQFCPEIKLIKMKKQWGNCSVKGYLTLNPMLVKAPRECIDYVIMHELCHFAEHNHSPNFYRLLAKVMPDWKKRKARLDGLAGYILTE